MISIETLYGIFQKHPVVTTDSRRITEGCIFFALKGDAFDGNAFAEASLAAGADYAVIDKAAFKKDDRYILVDDVLTTLQKLATHHRQQFDFPIIGIAGSNGKTTTKELVAATLSSHYNTLSTAGNLNNHIGVPLTLLQLAENHQVAVIEMGANHPNELHELCEIAQPTHGLITNIGKEHLEGFGGLEGVKQAESEIYRWLAQHNGTIFINDDEEFLHELLPTVRKDSFVHRTPLEGEGVRVINYHHADKPSLENFEYEIALLAADPFLKVGFLNSKNELLHAKTKLVGSYNFGNIATAIAVGKYFKVPTHKVKIALENYVPSMNRSQVVILESGATLIKDAYNANPTSMQAALRSLTQMPQQRKIAIIGDMFELGEYSEAEHFETLQFAKSLNFSTLVTIGKEFGKAVSLLETQNTEGVHFDTTAAAREWFQEQKFDADTCLLIKASRSMKLETIL
jgi:UDP-N-acetylmuramoyl-tripeptide--D-alanyl-D-alanine ligase